mmetsp:Transcript_93021/g.161689  ORF Transcript_93021/g.161689 Transcript_93021/m.161689 type:complete len:110 (-) Transcript_93021:1287-1616(-)
MLSLPALRETPRDLLLASIVKKPARQSENIATRAKAREEMVSRTSRVALVSDGSGPQLLWTTHVLVDPERAAPTVGVEVHGLVSMSGVLLLLVVAAATMNRRPSDHGPL